MLIHNLPISIVIGLLFGFVFCGTRFLPAEMVSAFSLGAAVYGGVQIGFYNWHFRSGHWFASYEVWWVLGALSIGSGAALRRSLCARLGTMYCAYLQRRLRATLSKNPGPTNEP